VCVCVCVFVCVCVCLCVCACVRADVCVSAHKIPCPHSAKEEDVLQMIEPAASAGALSSFARCRADSAM